MNIETGLSRFEIFKRTGQIPADALVLAARANPGDVSSPAPVPAPEESSSAPRGDALDIKEVHEGDADEQGAGSCAQIGDDATQLEFTQTMADFKIMFPDIEVDAIEAIDANEAIGAIEDNEPGGGQGELFYWSSTLGWQAGCYLCCFDNEPGGGQGERTRIRRPNQCAVTSENSPNNGEKSEIGKKEKTNPYDFFYPSFFTPAPASGDEPTPSPGDAFKFLSVPCLYQCHALLPRAQPCEKIFANLEDFEAHCISVHRISGRAGQNFWQVLYIDSLNNLYIL